MRTLHSLHNPNVSDLVYAGVWYWNVNTPRPVRVVDNGNYLEVQYVSIFTKKWTNDKAPQTRLRPWIEAGSPKLFFSFLRIDDA